MQTNQNGSSVSSVPPLLIVNPVSGPDEDDQLVANLEQALHDQGLFAEIRTTTPDENGQGLAAAAAQARTPLVMVAGGDGTIEAVARGLAHTQTVLGIIPQGTRNNIAASLNIPVDTTQAIRVLTEGCHRQFDLGRANNHYFMEVVGVGLEASLFPRGDKVKDGIKNNYWTALKNFFLGMVMFLQFKQHRLVLRFDGHKVRLRTLQVNICNSPRYGVEFALAPEAKMNDGKLDLIYIDKPSKWDHLRQFFAAMRSKQLPHERLKLYQTSAVAVHSYPALDVHADGDYIGTTPVIIEALPQALWICVPTPELLTQFADADVAAEQAAKEKSLFSWVQTPNTKSELHNPDSQTAKP
ncbi:diacylglycerol/lipid kinase family protein [Nodosilinea sp. E11]|uniref:diacylglycerol/lipid kinase family protein n=1 Tax=Nodosilinea sp. E11 TaxID=3037479 RepID=UPI0029351CDC|nr:YegS/Rv2252/BmrU family lipid kinase [Nodosilinea sp. E11]WOD41814.1 YegS/Rv2252/BmrU family lipid kinase [Nodosilinea sp. E11]